jgi:hypothetical protein
MSRAEREGFPEPPFAGDEVATLLGSLERQRATFAWKSGGLDETGLNAKVGTSSVTLGGLLKHLAFMEDLNLSKLLLGRDLGPPWDAVDRDAAGQRWDWLTTGDSPEQLYALWQNAVDRSRAAVAEALATGRGLAQPVRDEIPDTDQQPTMRRVLIDMIEEYARHVGHADLIRESVDGLVGEDPPGSPYPYQVLG